MDFIKTIKENPIKLLKTVIFIFIGVIAILFLLRFILLSVSKDYSLSQLATGGRVGFTESVSIAPEYRGDVSKSNSVADLSYRNVYDESGATMGSGAENFEVTDWNSTIETNHLEKTCAIFTDLKKRDDVIFESSNLGDTACYFSFKVEKENIDEIINLLKELHPKYLSQDIYTIKSALDDYTAEREVLLKKLSSIEDTLNSAIAAYEDITTLASKTQNVESLAKIIDSRIGIIERLTKEKIAVSEQLDRLGRSEEMQKDRLLYSYVHVSVQERLYVDWKFIKDSWKYAVSNFVSDINRTLQDITLGLGAFLFILVQYIIYLLIIVFAGKFVWSAVKRIWIGKEK